jgi:Domain of unknown function (DUF4440)
MDERTRVAEAAEQIAAAIGRRDSAAIWVMLAPGFSHRTHGGPVVDAEGFLHAVEQIPGSITAIRLEGLQIDLYPTGALATGVQLAEVVVDGQTIVDRRLFVDWFVRHLNEWRIQAAVDLPAAAAD